MKKPKTTDQKVKKVKKNPTQYTLDFDFKGLLFFISLSLLTALVVFYLGWIMGMGSRDPNIAEMNVKEEVIAEKNAEKMITADDLEIYNIRESKRISHLKDDTKSILKEADRVLKESKNKEPVSVEKDTTKAKTKPATSKAKPQNQWPEESVKKKGSQELYTVQVIATRDREKAEKYVRLLKEKEFEAYLTTATIENKVLYRVRVGRKSRVNIEKMNINLKKVIGGMGIKAKIIKIN